LLNYGLNKQGADLGIAMSQTVLPLYEELLRDPSFKALGLAPAELHGGLCGFLCGGGAANAENWLALVLSDDAIHEVQPETLIAQMYDASCIGLASEQFEFDMLLPDAEAPIDERGGALVDWCRGFLGGVGLAGTELTKMSEETQDALSDVGKIAASDLSYEDSDSDEEAFEEVAEFVRVAAMLVHSDCVLGPRHRRKLN
jgi:uncharacterized protein